MNDADQEWTRGGVPVTGSLVFASVICALLLGLPTLGFHVDFWSTWLTIARLERDDCVTRPLVDAAGEKLSHNARREGVLWLCCASGSLIVFSSVWSRRGRRFAPPRRKVKPS